MIRFWKLRWRGLLGDDLFWIEIPNFKVANVTIFVVVNYAVILHIAVNDFSFF